MSSSAGHGDLNAGDSVGSVMTQITLVLGILPFAGGRLDVGPYRAAIVPLLSVAALVAGIFLVADGNLSRTDGAALVLAWALATAVAAASLLLVAAGAGAAVKAMTELSLLAGIPEYLISFFGSSVGTSLPEMVVTIVALRQGQRDIALGDVFGACLMDATLSIGVGPLIAPTAVTAGLAVRGAWLAIAAMLLASLIIWWRRRHDRLSGAILLLMYAAAYVIM